MWLYSFLIIIQANVALISAKDFVEEKEPKTSKDSDSDFEFDENGHDITASKEINNYASKGKKRKQEKVCSRVTQWQLIDMTICLVLTHLQSCTNFTFKNFHFYFYFYVISDRLQHDEYYVTWDCVRLKK